MCKIPTTQKPKRAFTWLCNDPRRLLSLGARAPVAVTVGRDVTCYWLEPTAHGWRLLKELPTGEPGEKYHVDTSFGSEPVRDWTCDCQGFRYRRGCKHTALVAKVEEVLGLR